MALNINLNGVEATANKSTNVNTDQASNTKYPSVKALYDWAVGLFARATRTISTTSPLSGGGDLSADRTLSISQSNTTTNGYLSSTDWNTFNNKLSTSTAGTTYIPYTGATLDVDLGTKEITSGKLHSYGGATVGGNGTGYSNGFIDFNNSSNALSTRLQAGVNTQSITLNLPTANGTVGQNLSLTATNQLGWATPTIGGDMFKSTYDVDNTGVVDNAEAIQIIGRNSTGSTLYKGTVVYISGSTGNRPNFVKSQANSESTSAGTFGIIASDLANNADGYAVCIGYLDNLDTRSGATHPFTSDTLADGDTIYLSPTTAGYITNIKPSAPNHLVYLGKVTRTSPTNGTIVYRIQNGYELEELHNVAIASVANNDILQYETSTSLWKNKAIPTASSSVNGYLSSTDWTTFNAKVTANSAITGATKTKITYDTKGLVTSGADATTADISDSTNKRYVTDANLTVIGNTSGTNTGDQTFLNARVQSVTSAATVTPTSTNDLVKITAQAVGLTIANQTGTMTEGQALMIRIKDNGTAQTIAFGTNYRAIGVTLPTTTTISKTIYLGCIWNDTDTKFDILGVNIQA
jgi:hypothetical protein